MKVVNLEDATSALTEYTRDIDREPIVLTRNGEPVGAIVSLENIDLETVSLSLNPKFIDIIERSRSRQQAEGGIPLEQAMKQLELDS